MTFLGWLSDPFKGLSDLQLGDEKVTLNHLEIVSLYLDSELSFVFAGPSRSEKSWDSNFHFKIFKLASMACN